MTESMSSDNALLSLKKEHGILLLKPLVEPKQERANPLTCTSVPFFLRGLIGLLLAVPLSTVGMFFAFL
ncbi:hypothetical protein KSD_78440 [Ktedonobacter sp. SOSP1-85]|nr:hypothetical protein KSD_78440 [Ktedonobacter sp. SOSP1-85]